MRPTFDPYKTITLLPDNTKHSAGELSRMFDISQSSISRKVRAGKKVWTREELRSWSASIKKDPRHVGGFRETKSQVIKSIDDVIYNPTPMERALMGVR